MLKLPGGIKVYVANQPIHMGLSFDGLARQVESVLNQNPFAGHLFIFFSRRADKVKILYWDQNGFALWYKRLEKGVFRRLRVEGEHYCLSMSELSLLLEGVDLSDRNRHTALVLN